MKACIRHFSSGKNKKRDPAGYCATLMRETEEHCAKQRSAQYTPELAPPVSAPSSGLPPPVTR